MNGVHWADGHVEWLQRKFPELTGPVYIRGPLEVNQPPQPGAVACYHATGDLQMRTALTERGQWAGRGCSIVIEDVGEFLATPWPTQLAIVAHEVAHHFESVDDPRRASDYALSPLETIAAAPGGAELLCSHFGVPMPDVKAIRATHHGAGFVRAALHVWQRCKLELALAEMRVFTRSPPAAECVFVLAEELLAGGSIVDVLRSPMPKLYREVWNLP